MSKDSTIAASKVSRRNFLKGAAALTAVAAIGDSLFDGPLTSLKEGVADEAPKEDRWIRSVCRCCRVHCPIQVHVVDGVAVKIDGIPGEPNGEGKICGKSQSGLMTLYNPYRVKSPMKRTNPEKGLGVDPQWVEISWDEALDTVAEKIKDALETDPNSLDFYMSNFGDSYAKNVMSEFYKSYNENMRSLLNSGIGWQDGVCGDTAHRVTLRHLGGFVESTDYEYCKYIIVMGTNFFGSGKGYPAPVRGFLNAKENGMKVVVLDPVQADVARMADEWIPIKPGTDHAFALGMLYTLVVENDTYDKEYQKHNTNGPYLIGPDGMYVRSETETVEDPFRLGQTFGKPLIWDPVDNVAKTFDDPTIKDFAMDGTYTVNGVECRPGFSLFMDFIQDYSPEWAEEICDVSADTIRRIATEFGEAASIGTTMTFYDDPEGPYEVPYRPVAIDFQKGAQAHYHGILAGRAIGLLYTLLGAANVVGSSRGSEGLRADQEPGVDGVVTETNEFSNYAFSYPPKKSKDIYFFGPETLDMDIIAEPEKHPEEAALYGEHLHKKVLFHHLRNPLRSRGTGKHVEAGLKSVDFIWCMPLVYDEMTEMSDVLLPEGSYLERWQCLVPGTRALSGTWWEYKQDYIRDFEALQQPVVETLHDTRQMLDIMGEIAKRVGNLEAFNKAANVKLGISDEYALELDKQYTIQEMLDAHLKSKYDAEHDLEWFMENGYYGLPSTSRKEWYGYVKHPNTRFPVYDEWWVWAREQYKADREKYGLSPHEAAYTDLIPLPEWHGVGPLGEAAAEYNLFGCHYGNAFSAMCTPQEDPWKGDYNEKFAQRLISIQLHTSVANDLGIETGDHIVVESQFGNVVEGSAYVSEAIRPDCIGISGGGPSDSVNVGPYAHQGTHFNRLISHESKEHDQVSGNADFTVMVKVTKA